MATPALTHEQYAGELYRGELDGDAFASALPRATARLVAITGGDVPARCERAWLGALCAMVDRVAGLDRSGTVSSETVGSTSVTYADAVAGASDLDAVAPWLAGTGLLYMGVGDR